MKVSFFWKFASGVDDVGSVRSDVMGLAKRVVVAMLLSGEEQTEDWRCELFSSTWLV